MNLTLHHFRKDIRQFRIILLVWFVVLGLGLAGNLGWVCGVRSDRTEGGGSLNDVWVGALTFFLWLLFLLIPSAVVLADSPSRREGFLRTRPLPGRDLFLAKALFVIALILVPALIQEWLYLTISSVSSGYVMHGVLERLLYALPIVAVATSFASLWRSYSQWAAGLVIAVAGTLGSLMLVELLSFLAGRMDLFAGVSSAPGASRSLAAIYAFGLAAILLAVMHARQVWGAYQRWLGIALVMVVYVVVNMYWPWTLFKIAPADSVAAQAVFHQSPLNVPPRGLQLVPIFGGRLDGRLDFALNVVPQVNAQSFPSVIEWKGRQTQLFNASGQSFSTVRPFSGNSANMDYNAFLRNTGNPSTTELNIWAALLPKEAFFRLGQTYFYSGEEVASLGEFKLDSRQSWLNEPVTIKTRLDGQVYRWDKVADFGLAVPVTIRDQEGMWAFLARQYVAQTKQHHLIFRRSQVSFATATDARTVPFNYGPHDRYDFVLYHPGRNVARIADNSYNVFSTRGGSTALAQYWLDLAFSENFSDEWKTFAPEEMAECHLLIFQKTWLGTVSADWEYPGLVINHTLTPVVPNSSNNQDGLSLSEIQRRLAELALPGPQATRTEVCHYLVQALPIMDASRYLRSPGEAVIAKLATLVPVHLDVLLDGLPAMGHASQNAVIQAITQGALESQKNQIIAALPANPGLMQAVFQRGWVTAARDTLYQMLASPKPLSFEVIQAVVSFQDPQTYPRLLTEFEADPRSDIYDLLRSMPGMAEPLAASVTRLWQNQNHAIPAGLGNFQSVLGLAMHAGNADDLRFAYRLLDETASGRNQGMQNWGLAQAFRENVKLDEAKALDDQNGRSILDWMRRRQPDAFVYDSVRERFVLKADPTAGETTLNP